MKKDMSNIIAANMDAILKNPEYTSMFSSSAVLEKLAFKRVADEEVPTEVEIEFSNELSQEPLESQASSPRADCVACGKTRQGWTEAMGVCKCGSDGCSPMGGCKEGCSCGCKAKKAGVSMDDVLVKSAVDSLLKVSSDLEDAGFERLSAYALVLTNELVAEAKAKKDKKDDKKAKEKQKMKEKAEKDKNAAKDKAMKEKAKMLKEKEKLKAEKAKKSGK